MGRTYLLVDIYNLFFRCMHTVNVNESEEIQDRSMIHTMITMMKNACDKFNPDHLVICSDGNKSWRKNVYNAYKANRIERLQDRSPTDAMREERLKDIFKNDFLPFLKDKTNVSFLSCELAEADDLIARFIEKHSNDMCVILSTDGDYIQLLSDNVIIYNSMSERIIYKNCVFTSDKKHLVKFTLKDGKISVAKDDWQLSNTEPLVPMKDWIEYSLFMKCIRGDKSDNILSAFPRVRETSTKKQVGIRDAFEDRNDRGYNWQSFMNSTWENPLGEKKLVKECYEFNKKLIDLKEIPDNYKESFDKSIENELLKESQNGVGFNLMKYLKKWDLERLLENVQSFSGYFSKSYPKEG